MADSNKKPSLEDYLLVEIAGDEDNPGETGRTRLDSLDQILLPISESGPIENLEYEIDQAKEFLTQLSIDFASNHQSIEEIDKLYERKSVTSYMASDPEILKEGRIKEMIEDSAILTKEEVDDKHDDMQSDLETKYEEINSLIEGWFERE